MEIVPFEKFEKDFQNHVSVMLKDANKVFAVTMDPELLWNTYLESFPAGTNEIYRKRREYDCGHCRHFIKDIGNVVTIVENKIVTVWDFEAEGQFLPVVKALSELVRRAAIENVYVTKEKNHGNAVSRESIEGTVRSWHHFYVELPKKIVFSSAKSEAAIMGEFRDTKNVFKRGLDEISRNAIETVLEMMDENILYRGDEWKANLRAFYEIYEKYHALKDEEKDNFCWIKSTEINETISKIRNHSIGTLLKDLTEGVEIDEALRKWEKVMAPEGYKRTVKAYTKKQKEEALKFVVDNGFENSLGRRHAVLSDITINNVIWANPDAKKVMLGVNELFSKLDKNIEVDKRKFKDAQNITVEDFVKTVLPNASSVEVLMENKHQSNLVSLIAPQNKDSKTLFKWSNPYSWAYGGNLADSSMKDRVKSAGGNVSGVWRNSAQWNHFGDYNNNDYDLHVTEPGGNEIYFRNQRVVHPSSGVLDVDITHPERGIPAVENISYSDERKIREGTYIVRVHCWNHRGGRSGFDAEIEFGGVVHEFAYHKDVRQDEYVTIAEVNYNRTNGFTIKSSLPSTNSSKVMWNLTTNHFVPVSVFMYSPNFWDEQVGIGNKHYFFMLADCVNGEQPNGFYNEYLAQELMAHKYVFDALGSLMKVEKSDNQLSGLGFSSTKRDAITVKVDNRIMNIVF